MTTSQVANIDPTSDSLYTKGKAVHAKSAEFLQLGVSVDHTPPDDPHKIAFFKITIKNNKMSPIISNNSGKGDHGIMTIFTRETMLTMLKKLQNIVQTMYLTRCTAHPYSCLPSSC